MQPKISLFALAESSIVEKNTNKTTIVGVFNFYQFSELPANLISFLCYIRLYEIKSAKSIIITLRNIDGTVNNHVTYDEIAIPDGDNALNIATIFNNITINSFGKHNITITVDGVDLESTPEQWLNIIKNE